MTSFEEAAMQAQSLPLAAAHFAPAIEMENFHGLWRTSEMCRVRPCARW